MPYINPHIEICLEGSHSVFKGLPQKDKEIIAEHHSLTQIQKGHYLFKEGEKPHGLICLASGKVKVFKEGVGRRKQILKMVGQHGLIGYRAIYSNSVWSVSAIAIEDTTICLLDKNSLLKILKKNADLGLKFIKIISEELWFSNNRIVSLTQKHIRGRLAESLLLLADTYGYEADGKTIKVYLSREDVANLSNMTTSNGIRTLSNLASEGIIEIKGRRITIIDITKLEHISEIG